MLTIETLYKMLCASLLVVSLFAIWFLKCSFAHTNYFHANIMVPKITQSYGEPQN
jgi:hypothetical protein